MKDFKHWGIRIRKDINKNYYSLWVNLKTIRLDLGDTIELPADRSEFYDVGLGTRCNAECPFCVPGDTEIITPEGKKPIKDIKTGDLVMSYNECDGKSEFREVCGVSERDYEGDIIEIESESGKTIKLTPNHKVYTQRGYVKAEDLKKTDTLRINNVEETIKELKKENSSLKVYNIEVKQNSNYFANDILVHNCYVSAKGSGEFWANPAEIWKRWMSMFPEDIVIDPNNLPEDDEYVQELFGPLQKDDTANVVALKFAAQYVKKKGYPVVYTQKPFQIAIGK